MHSIKKLTTGYTDRMERLLSFFENNETAWGGRIGLTQDRDQWKALVNTVMNLRVPYNFAKFLSR
jgi:hypothetical protein